MLFIFHLIQRIWSCFSKRLLLNFSLISFNGAVVSFLFNSKELKFYVLILLFSCLIQIVLVTSVVVTVSFPLDSKFSAMVIMFLFHVRHTILDLFQW